MQSKIDALVRELCAEEQVALPDSLSDTAPRLRIEAMRDDAPYVVGLIGGKDVGKSALINALAGQTISQSSDHGAGTEQGIAYVHRQSASAAGELLEELAGMLRLVEHEAPALRRQVLLDLPDIDSIHDHHIALTRRALRRMLHPAWVQSVEKYADAAPLALLKLIAEGNDPANFIFCLNKMDQAPAAEHDALVDDYARRLQKALKLPAPPRVYRLSAARPDEYDLPELRRHLAHDRAPGDVRQGLRLAAERQRRGLAHWLKSLDLPGRIAAVERAGQDYHQQLTREVIDPLQSRCRGMLQDARLQRGLLSACWPAEAARWPLVRTLHGMLWAVRGLFDRTQPASPTPWAEALVDDALGNGDERVARALGRASAEMKLNSPVLAELYGERGYWQDAPAQGAERDLAAGLRRHLLQLRASAAERLAPTRAWMAPPRWMATWGAAIWFPLAQPVLERWTLGVGLSWQAALVQALGVWSLLGGTLFVLAWLVVLWLTIGAGLRRRIARSVASDASRAEVAALIEPWAESLLEPVTRKRERLIALHRKAHALVDAEPADEQAA